MAAEQQLEEIFGGSDSELDELQLELSDDEDEKKERKDKSDDDVPTKLPSFKKKDTAQVDLSEELKRRPKKKARSKRRRGSDDRGRGDGEIQSDEEAPPERELSPQSLRRREVDEDFAAALKRNRPVRRKKDDGDDTGYDDFITHMVQEMKQAAFKDQDLNRQRKPAITKLMMLPAVMGYLQRENLYNAFLENHILNGIKMWLEPLPDGSLPSLDIQTNMFNTLKKMPVATIHLRDSLIGRIINFYSKCPRVTPDIQKIAGQLVDRWMRLILDRSASYRDHKVGAGYDPITPKRPQGTPRLASPVVKQEEESKRARIPHRIAPNYTVLPESSFTPVRSEDRTSKTQNDKYKRLQQKLKLMKGGGRR